jgi:acetyl esterase/lipase
MTVSATHNPVHAGDAGGTEWNMSTSDFHPDLRRVARVVPRELIKPRNLRLLRASSELPNRRRPAGVDVLTLASGVDVRLYRPGDTRGPAPALLWIHGGGYVFGNAAMDDGLCRRFADVLRITVASVDYRLAAEHPFPEPLDECDAAWAWLTELPSVDPARVAIGGASAGGGLAAALALRARDTREVAPVLQLLVYPMLDDRTVLQSNVDGRMHRLKNQASNRFAWASYLGTADRVAAVPARHPDLTGLPPAWIGVGTLDLLHDAALEYAERLKDAGVPCTTEVVRGAFHCFDVVAPWTRVSRSFFASQCASLRAAFGRTAAT